MGYSDCFFLQFCVTNTFFSLLKTHSEVTIASIEKWLPILLNYCVESLDKDRSVAISILGSVIKERPTTVDFGAFLQEDVKKVTRLAW